MPLWPPGNALFRAYIDQQGKYHAVYIGPDPIVCRRCGRTTYRTVSGRCPWASFCRPAEERHG
jgi:ribosomal protein L37E